MKIDAKIFSKILENIKYLDLINLLLQNSETFYILGYQLIIKECNTETAR